jgi:hypothetical protein
MSAPPSLVTLWKKNAYSALLCLSLWFLLLEWLPSQNTSLPIPPLANYWRFRFEKFQHGKWAKMVPVSNESKNNSKKDRCWDAKNVEDLL